MTTASRDIGETRDYILLGKKILLLRVCLLFIVGKGERRKGWGWWEEDFCWENGKFTWWSPPTWDISCPFFFFLIPLYWRWDFSWSLHQCGQETISAEQSYWVNFSFSAAFRFYCLLTLYTLTAVCKFSILFSIHFLRYWQGEFVKKSRASLDSREALNHFLYSGDLNVWFRGYIVMRN